LETHTDALFILDRVYCLIIQVILKTVRTIGNLARDRLTVWEFLGILHY